MTDLDKKMISALSDYIKIDTSNPPGDCSRAVSYLTGLLAGFGYEPLVDGLSEEKSSILCNIGGKEGPGVALIHHMDVVPARSEEWSFPPFIGEVREGYMLGRGTLDTKGLGMAQIFGALKAVKEAGKLKKKVFIVANPDEEVGGDDGAGYFVKNHGGELSGCFGMNEGGIGVRDLFGVGDYFLVNMWEKGPLWLKLVAKGRAGHGSRPTQKDPTIRLVRGIERLISLQEEPELTEPVRDMLSELEKRGAISLGLSEDSPLPSSSQLATIASSVPEMEAIMKDTVAVTMLNAGFKPNVIPAVASAAIDVRILPGRAPEDIVKKVKKMLADLDIQVEVLYAASPSGSERTEFFDLIIDVLHKLYPGSLALPYLSTGFTDSRYYRGVGVVTYGIMPCVIPKEELGRIHGVDERISVDSVVKASEFFKRILLTLERK
jgi:acetylornithine deacetylase/succinyl-diaminopimelate desuccinylase-like protein